MLPGNGEEMSASAAPTPCPSLSVWSLFGRRGERRLEVDPADQQVGSTHNYGE
jgi:hypothetical protein